MSTLKNLIGKGDIKNIYLLNAREEYDAAKSRSFELLGGAQDIYLAIESALKR